MIDLAEKSGLESSVTSKDDPISKARKIHDMNGDQMLSLSEVGDYYSIQLYVI